MESFLPAIFKMFNLAVMPLWFGLLFFPRKRWTNLSIDAFAVIAATAFTVNLIPGLREIFPIVLDPNLISVGGMLATPRGSFGGWTHFLIGDLCMGRWMVSDSHARGVAHSWILPSLVLTLLFGPVGMLSYFGVRTIAVGFLTRRHNAQR
jgi:hypothetical protein